MEMVIGITCEGLRRGDWCERVYLSIVLSAWTSSVNTWPSRARAPAPARAHPCETANYDVYRST